MADSNDSPQSKPNVVFMLGDNVGWGDLGCYGGLAPTPRLDALAEEGLRLKNYNVEAQCTPTRSAIISPAVSRSEPATAACHFRGRATTGSSTGSTRWAICSRTPATPPPPLASGTSGTRKGGCPPIRDSTAGSGSRTHPTRPLSARTPCSPSPGSRSPRYGKASPDHR